MRVFSFTARDRRGTMVRRQIQARHRAAALARLMHCGYSEVCLFEGELPETRLLRPGIVGMVHRRLHVPRPEIALPDAASPPSDTAFLAISDHPPRAHVCRAAASTPSEPTRAPDGGRAVPPRRPLSARLFDRVPSWLRARLTTRATPSGRFPLPVSLGSGLRARLALACSPVLARASAKSPYPVPDGATCRISVLERMTLLRTLACMLEVGIPLCPALSAQLAHCPDSRVRNVLRRVYFRVSEGAALSAAFASCAGAFHPRHFRLLVVGEECGDLPDALRRLAEEEKRRYLLARRIWDLLTYPVCVLAGATLLLLATGGWLLAACRPMLMSAHVSMAPLSVIVLGTAAFLTGPRGLVFLVVTAIVVGTVVSSPTRCPGMRDRLERLAQALPILGATLRLVEAARVCATLSVLCSSGVSLLQSLELAVDDCVTEAGRRAVRAALCGIRQGRSLSDALAGTAFFSRTTVHLIAAGEEAGQLPSVLRRVVDSSDLEIQLGLERFVAVAQPVAIVWLGALVAAIIVIVLAPLYEVASLSTTVGG